MLNLFQHLKIDLFKRNMDSRKTYFIYILTNLHDSTFYIGVTNNLQRRIYEHKTQLVEGFTKQYRLTKLIYYEEYNHINEAIKREKQLKNWHRGWKIKLIKNTNPQFIDLSLRWSVQDPKILK